MARANKQFPTKMTHEFAPKAKAEPENDKSFRARTPKDVSQVGRTLN